MFFDRQDFHLFKKIYNFAGETITETLFTELTSKFKDCKPMKKVMLVLLLAMLSVSAWGQKFVLSGWVANDRNGDKIPQAIVSVPQTNVTVVTNDDGYFTLKVDEVPQSIVVSHLSFESKEVSIPDSATHHLNIRLKPTSIPLHEIVVWTEDPEALVSLAMDKIPSNYSKKPMLYNCFYRETAMKRQHFIYVAEGVVDMYKTDYRKGIGRDRVAIKKGRRLLSPKRSDTLSVKVMGGPVQPIELDIVKNRNFLLDKTELANYRLKMEPSEMIDNRLQYVVSISPNNELPYALYYGKLYIDRETLSFTRVELSLDMKDKDKATNLMLISKPRGVRFKPKELSCLVEYRYEKGVTHISYIRNTFRFNGDWKRKLFSTSYAAFCEMVVTDKQSDNVQPISGRNSFDSHDSFYDKVDFFLDPTFWEDYNIIEPTETLNNAIDKLLKKHKRK